MGAIAIADWGNFFVAEVGASAALSGLVVVAISINLNRIISFPQLPKRAAEALTMLVGVLVVTSIGLIPAQPARALGAEVFLVGLVMLVCSVTMQVQSFQAMIEHVPLVRRLLHVLLGAASSLPIAGGGVLLFLGFDMGLYWIAAGVIISLVGGVFNAWVLLIEILR